MTDIDARIRRATRQDAAAMTELINIAGEGLPLYLWERMAETGEDAWAVGRRRAQREAGGFSYRNTLLGDVRGEVAGGLVGYPLADEPEPIDADLPAMFVPLQELENLAVGTWYVNVLACFPEQRGRGLGRRLLERAEVEAEACGKPTMSIMVADRNAGARRLYERCGFRDVDGRPIVKDDWANPSDNWVLMIKAA